MAGLYIHIPFCRSKCSYCDFYSASGYKSDIVGRYVDCLLIEFDIRLGEVASERIETVYLGGGTPSLLYPHNLSRLCRGLNQRLDMSVIKEWTIEANPEDIDYDFLNLLRDCGINRVSIGIQSFDDRSLSVIGRNHCSRHSIEAINLLSKSGWNYSADLMYGLPFQTIEMFNDDLKRLLDYNPPHFSAYILTVDPHTRLGVKVDKSEIKLPDDGVIEQMYAHLCRFSSARGYCHYEISNFSRPEFESIHNSSYWNGTSYIGLGAGAHSFDGYMRRVNNISTKRYIDILSSGNSAFEIETESETARLNDYIFTALRTKCGIDINYLSKHFINQYKQVVTALDRDNRLIKSCGKYYIPEPEWLMSDYIIRDHLVI